MYWRTQIMLLLCNPSYTTIQQTVNLSFWYKILNQKRFDLLWIAVLQTKANVQSSETLFNTNGVSPLFHHPSAYWTKLHLDFDTKPFIHTGWHAVCTKANKNNKGCQLFDIKTMGQIIVVQKFFIIIFYVRNHVPFHNHLYSNPYPVAHEFGCTYIHFQYWMDFFQSFHSI